MSPEDPQDELLRSEFEALKAENDFLRAENERLSHQFDDARKMRDDLTASLSWRLTAPIRKIVDMFLRGRLLAVPPTPTALTTENYRRWIAAYDSMNKAGRRAIQQCINALPQPLPLISVVTDSSQGRVEDLAAMIRSLRAQIYPQWELCAIDNGSSAPEVARLFGSFSRDPRIRVVRDQQVRSRRQAHQAGACLARGSALVFLDPACRLAESALFEAARALIGGSRVVYSDEDRIGEDGARYDPAFKSGWNPDLLESTNYLGSFVVYDRTLYDAAGALSAASDHQVALQLTARAAGAHHVPSVLCHRAGPPPPLEHRVIAPSSAAVAGQPLVSIIIPNRDRADLLGNFLKGVLKETDYPSIEVILVDNASREPATRELYRSLESDSRVRILSYPGDFNWSAMNNAAAHEAKGEVLLFANNDLEVIDPKWLAEMVRHAMREEVGAVGAKLLFPDRSIQHAGVFVGPEGKARHPFRLAKSGDAGYLNLLRFTRNVSAVTGACLAMRRKPFDQVEGFATELRVSFSDVDLCLNLLEKGYRIVWCAEAQLLHLESASRGSNEWRWSEEEKERLRFVTRHAAFEDAFFNPNLDLINDQEIGLAFPPRTSKPWRTVSVSAP